MPTKSPSPPSDLTTAHYWNNEWCHIQQASRASRRRTHSLTLLLARLLDRSEISPIDVLEVGCAPGTMLLQLATIRPSHRLHGVDFSRPGLAQAERLLASRNVPATLHHGDFREFESERRYGLVYSAGLIEHFNDPAAELAHHVRLCAPGGYVAVSVPNLRGRAQEWFIRQLDPDALRAHNLQIMDVDSLRQVLHDAGLQDVVAGSDGPSTIYSCNARRSFRTSLLQRFAQSWNLANKYGLRLSPRRSVIWAYGRAA